MPSQRQLRLRFSGAQFFGARLATLRVPLRQDRAQRRTPCDFNRAANRMQDVLLALEKMPSAQDPWAFAASFRLKILRHDGLFGLGTDCAVCQIPLLHHYVGMGESYCQEHAEDIHLVLSDEEAKTILNLAHCRSFRWLQSIAIENHVKEKVQILFQAL